MKPVTSDTAVVQIRDTPTDTTDGVPQITTHDNHPASGHHPRSAALEDIPELLHNDS